MTYRDDAHRRSIYDEVESAQSEINAGTARPTAAFQGLQSGVSGVQSPELNQMLAEDGIAIPTSAPVLDEPMVWMGDGELPRSAAFSAVYGLSTARLRSFQQRAVEMGLLDTVTGRYDPETVAAWRQAVDASAGFYSQGRKIGPFDALGYIGLGADADGDKPKTLQVTNPADIREALRAAAVDTLGTSKVDDSVVAEAVEKYHALQRNYQQVEGGTAVAPPTLETFAADEARRVDPVRADSRQAVAGFEFLAKKLIGG